MYRVPYSISTSYTLCYFVSIKDSEVGTSYIFFSDMETSLKNVSDLIKIKQSIHDSLPTPNSALPCCLHTIKTISYHGLSIKIK